MGTRLMALASITAWMAADVHGHGGGLDAQGCHHVRKTGEYHCHRAPLPAGVLKERRRLAGADDDPAALAAPAPAPAPPVADLERCRAITESAKRLECLETITGTGPAQPVPTVERCRPIVDPAKRLACFDAVPVK